MLLCGSIDLGHHKNEGRPKGKDAEIGVGSSPTAASA